MMKLYALLIASMITSKVFSNRESCLISCSDNTGGSSCEVSAINCPISVILEATSTEKKQCSPSATLIISAKSNHDKTISNSFTITGPQGFSKTIPYTLNQGGSITQEVQVPYRGLYTISTSIVFIRTTGVTCHYSCSVDIKASNCFIPLMLYCCK